MTKYDILAEMFVPSRGMVEVFLGSTYTKTLADARREGRLYIEKGEKLIVRKATVQTSPSDDFDLRGYP